MKSPNKGKIDYLSVENIENIVQSWRLILGVDPIYDIGFKVSEVDDPEYAGSAAWISGLTTDTVHPIVTINFNIDIIGENRYDKEYMLDTIIHELLHIVTWEAFVMADPTYEYKGLKARASEILVMKLTNAILKTHKESKKLF